MFASLRKHGFQLNHPDSRLYVCPRCVNNTDAAVASILGYQSNCFHAMNVKRDVPMAHKKLLPSKVAKSVTSAAVTDAAAAAGGSKREEVHAMQLSSPQQGSGGTDDAVDGAAGANKDLATVQAAQEIPVVKDFLADKTRRSASLMGRKGSTNNSIYNRIFLQHTNMKTTYSPRHFASFLLTIPLFHSLPDPLPPIP